MGTRAPVSVRAARREDEGAIAGMLARAFRDDPVTAWFYPDDAKRLRHARRFFAIRLRQLRDQQQTYVASERAGAALWTLPGRWREGLRQSLMLLPMVPILLPRIARSVRAVQEIERLHPAKPHFYLSVLGTDPDRQGGGIGSALLAPVLDLCVGAYLESSRERNLDFYARHGFRVTDRIELPDDGPSLWLMWRDPR